ncbi:hypothetical protein AK88_03342 [Plasmodium fragile]|uniref:Uncharacterized protein n=1 Tax=Plasmodium fragile TaxID=5857 RepID=A0A0D9QMU9_PLAFR|nr:uncharacterized protein AK88_03342 [Plasmodium fragile]KJP87056.1 hypothetical protein AK88_03342 [Plasmodium fragile]
MDALLTDLITDWLQRRKISRQEDLDVSAIINAWGYTGMPADFDGYGRIERIDLYTLQDYM